MPSHSRQSQRHDLPRCTTTVGIGVQLQSEQVYNNRRNMHDDTTVSRLASSFNPQHLSQTLSPNRSIVRDMPVNYVKSSPISLRNHPLFSEKWLQKEIAEDPSILGLGDLELRSPEKIQTSGGRLDLLLEDSENGVRYEVEVQLGQTDPSHIIRTIEYWDLERRSAPKYSHIAVIVAEQITSRFFNVISLFNRAIPIIAIQVQALDVGGVVTIAFTKILDLSALGDDDDLQPVEPRDRNYWEAKATAATLRLADEVVRLIRDSVEPTAQLKYNKHYIGIETNGVVTNFISFRPRRHHVIVEFKIPRDADLDALLEDSPLPVLPYQARWGQYRLQISQGDVLSNKDLLEALIKTARENYGGVTAD